MHFLLYGQRLRPVDQPYIETLLSYLDKNGIQYSIYSPLLKKMQANAIRTNHTYDIDSYEMLKTVEIDMLLSLGGDGTILHAVTLVKDLQIPIAGINLGRLGFLATIEKGYIEQAIQDLLDKKYRTEKRSMLSLESNKELFDGNMFALNDFTIHKRDDSSMIIIHTYINGDFLNSYWADGLVISTPTGSTGYNLSGGGPIIFPMSSNIAITPIAPHNLNVRPIVISEDDVLSFKIDGRDRNYLITLDSRSEKVSADIELTIKKSDWYAHIVVLENMSFIKTIHSKLYWGRDSRN